MSCGQTSCACVEGIPGFPGIPRPAGPPGAAGSHGNRGPVRSMGPRGSKGDEGARGRRGVEGLKGATGLSGATGARGSRGEKVFKNRAASLLQRGPSSLQLSCLLQTVVFHLQWRRVLSSGSHWWNRLHDLRKRRQERFAPRSTKAWCAWDSGSVIAKAYIR